MPSRREYYVETEMTVTTRYLVIVCEDENPWDVWKQRGKKVYISDEYGEEKPVSVERIKEGNDARSDSMAV